MANGKIKVDDVVRDALQGATTEGGVLTIGHMMDMDVYVKVNKVLSALGGKWNRGKGGHVFPVDAAPILAEILGAEEVIDKKKALDQYFTPESIVDLMIDTVGIEAGDLVLEPSAGDGRIAVKCRERGATVICCELDPEYVAVLRGLGFDTHEGDFLTLNLPVQIYNKVVMNPPFSNGLDVKHILHAWELLKPGGDLVAVASAGVTFRTTKLHQRLNSLTGWTRLPDESFKSEGTRVSSVMVLGHKEEA